MADCGGGSSSGIFGTPTEPLFNHQLCGATGEMLQDWLQMLHAKNLHAVKGANEHLGAAVTCDSVHFLFLTCERLKMPLKVKYLALEIFDRFMVRHVQDLHKHVLTTSSIKRRADDWMDILKRVKDQVILRVTSCVQIASKLTSHYKILSPEKARRFLLDTGHKYNHESIMQSELRVLKTLDFHVSVPSALVYLETLLEKLGRMELDVEVKVLHGVSQHFLDLLYLQYTEVLTRYHMLVTEGSPVTEGQRNTFLAKVRADKMLLMASVISSAAYIIYRDSHEKVMQCLSKITQLTVEDILSLTSAIVKVFLENEE